MPSSICQCALSISSWRHSKALRKNTAVRLLSQYTEYGEGTFLTELYQEDDADEVKAFIQLAIEQLPENKLLPKGHLAKPFKNG